MEEADGPCHTTGMIMVGVCGGVAAYKACELVRLLVRGGHDVQVVQTPDSQRFVAPTTFAALSRRPVLVDGGEAVFPHLEASADADLLCIAPLTATTLARIARGEAANVLTATALAFTGPIVAAPAMNPRMWRADATRENLRLLARRGIETVGPALGDTAEGEVGVGRMAEPEEILAAVTARLAAGQSMHGLRVLVTAGGTREPLDAVRYVGNRSSGRMGAAVADEAARRGGDVWHVALEPTPDILAGLGAARRPGQVLIGFAAEHGEGGVDRARRKLERKGADMIVMNDIT